MNKIIGLILSGFLTYSACAENVLGDFNKSIEIGPSLLSQESFNDSNVRPWGGTLGFSAFNTGMFSTISYGLSIDVHYLSGEVLYSNIENKIKHQGYDIALAVDIGLTDNLKLSGSYGSSSQKQEFDSPSNEATQTALDNIYSPVDGTSPFFSIGLKYLLGSGSSFDASSFFLLEMIKYSKFDSSIMSLRYGLTFGK